MLQLLASGQGDGQIVAKVDRLARSVVHAANILEDAQPQLDLSNAAGRMMARTVVNFAEYGRERISEHAKAELGANKLRGEPIGRPRLATPSIVRRIMLDRNSGLSFAAIARALAAEGILSPAGRPNWQVSTVCRIFQSATAATELAAG